MRFKELKEVLNKHRHWMMVNCDTWENLEIDLSHCDLSCLDLHNVNLSGANLCGANLSMANLQGADLQRVNLCGADLTGVILRQANLNGAKLCDALLFGANLYGANLCDADLDNADLLNARLNGANLYDVDLSCTKNIPFIPIVCPDTGAFIGWKKCEHNLIVKLEIPEDAKRLSSTGRKCRCDKAKVLEIQNVNGEKSATNKAFSHYDNDFVYEVGTIIIIPDFDENRWNECSTGIHFFVNRQEAVDYFMQ